MNSIFKIAAVAAAAMALTSCGSATVSTGTGLPDVVSVSENNYASENVNETVQTSTEPPTEPFSLNVDVPADHQLPQSYIIDGFKAVLQEPELPTGCEVTSLTADLNFLGFNIDKVTLCDDFMPIALAGECVMDEAYVGNPRYDGFGCNANVIVQTADSYFASVDSPCYGVDLTGQELSDVLYQVTQNRPVLVWSTIGLKTSYPEYVWTAANGKELVFDWYQHCMVVYGFDYSQGIVYAADPLEGNVTYPIDEFENIYGIMGKQAVVICGDASVKGHHVTTDAERSRTMPSYSNTPGVEEMEKSEAAEAND